MLRVVAEQQNKIADAKVCLSKTPESERDTSAVMLQVRSILEKPCVPWYLKTYLIARNPSSVPVVSKENQENSNAAKKKIHIDLTSSQEMEEAVLQQQAVELKIKQLHEKKKRAEEMEVVLDLIKDRKFDAVEVMQLIAKRNQLTIEIVVEQE